jgi:hypothetical protein
VGRVLNEQALKCEKADPIGGDHPMRNSTLTFLLGAAIVALIALGYIYWKDQNSISISTSDLKVPTVTVETN